MYSVQDTQLMLSGFPHSEISGSQSVCRLPEAYRRLPRLSSPLTAKASTVCAYSLDHITPSNLVIIVNYDIRRKLALELANFTLTWKSAVKTLSSSILLSLTQIFKERFWRKDQKSAFQNQAILIECSFLSFRRFSSVCCSM